MINTKNLHKKGIPIAREKSKNIIHDSSIAFKDKKKPLQVMISQELFEEFSTLAGQKFGFEKGAKSKLFLELWESYKTMMP